MSEAKKYQPAGTTPQQRQRARDVENAVFERTRMLEGRMQGVIDELAAVRRELSESRAALALAQERANVAERFVATLAEMLNWSLRRR